jgi:hypothetical protein
MTSLLYVEESNPYRIAYISLWVLCILAFWMLLASSELPSLMNTVLVFPYVSIFMSTFIKILWSHNILKDFEYYIWLKFVQIWNMRPDIHTLFLLYRFRSCTSCKWHIIIHNTSLTAYKSNATLTFHISDKSACEMDVWKSVCPEVIKFTKWNCPCSYLSTSSSIREGWSSGNCLDSYSGNAQFQFRPRHHLSSGFSWFSSVFKKKERQYSD